MEQPSEQTLWLNFLSPSQEDTGEDLPQLDYHMLLGAILGTSRVSVTNQQQQQQQQYQQQQQQFEQNIEEDDQQTRKAHEARAQKQHTGKSGTDNTKKLNLRINLIERYPNLFKCLSPKIVSISQAALAKINQHSQYFVDGVSLDNLPAGFFLDGNCLKFSQEVFETIQKEARETPYRNDYDEQPILVETSEPSVSSAPPTLQEFINHINPPSIENIPKITAPDLIDLGFTEQNLGAFRQILSQANGQLKIIGIITTLKQLKEKNPILYRNLKESFIDNSRDLSEFADIAILHKITDLNNMTLSEQEWWVTLTTQHTGATGVGPSSFLELYNIFNAFKADMNLFWQNVYGKPFEFTMPCPLTQSHNMQVALNLAAFIIKNAEHPDDQARNLAGLDLHQAQKEIMTLNRVLNTLPTSNYEAFFLQNLYTKSRNGQYFPKFYLAQTLFRTLDNEIVSSGIEDDQIKEALFRLAIDLLHHRIPAKEVYAFTKTIISYIKNHPSDPSPETSALLFSILSQYTTLHIAHGGKPDPRHLKIILTNPNIRRQYPNIFVFIDSKKSADALITLQLKQLPSEKQTEPLQRSKIEREINELLYKLKFAPKKLTKEEILFIKTAFEQLKSEQDRRTADIIAIEVNGLKIGEEITEDTIKKLREEVWQLGNGQLGLSPTEASQINLLALSPDTINDVYCCLLATSPPPIMEDFFAQNVPIVNGLCDLYQKDPTAISILARVLAHTDFNQKTVTLDELKAIITNILALDKIDYNSIREIVLINAPGITFLQDLEYIEELLSNLPQDLSGVIDLYRPLFNQVNFTIPETGDITSIAEAVVNQARQLGTLNPVTEENLKLLAADNNDDRVLGLIGAIQNVRDNMLLGTQIKNKLKEIITEQQETVKKLATSLNLSQDITDALITSLDEIDLTTGNLIEKSKLLVAKVTWILKFGSSIVHLSKSAEWQSSANAFFHTILKQENFPRVQTHISALIQIYQDPNLTNEDFISPLELVQKILANDTREFSQAQLDLITTIAEYQLEAKRKQTQVSKKNIGILIDIALRHPENDTTRALIELAFNHKSNFPINQILAFTREITDKYSSSQEANEQLKATIRSIQFLFNKASTPDDKKRLNDLLQILLSENSDISLASFYLQKITQNVTKTNYNGVLQVLLGIVEQETINKENTTETQANLFGIIAYLNYLTKSDNQLFNKIVKLYEQKPCPNSHTLMKALNSGLKIEDFVAQFEIDPYSTRYTHSTINEKMLQTQFATNEVNKVILGLRNANPHLENSPFILQGLRNDFNYVNLIGHKSNFPNTNRPVWQLSREEINAQLSLRKEIINDPQASPQKKYLAKLQAIALLREAMYRATGKMPNSTQILSVIVQSKYQGNICMQINTGEGKSITNPLLAAMQYLEGYAVNVFTSNPELARRDHSESTNFWRYLGIKTTFVARNSPLNTYDENAINYTTPPDFALYSAAHNPQVKKPMAGVYDESDLAFYETNTEYNFSDSIDKETSDPYVNPYAWAYPIINKFLDSEQYKLLREKLKSASTQRERQKISSAIANLLRATLKSQANTEQVQKIGEDSVDNNRLLRWLTAAEGVVHLEEGVDYIITLKQRREFGVTKSYREIVLLDGEKRTITGAVLANGAHQLLSARLQLEERHRNGPPFVIDKESFCVSSRSAHTELLRMAKIIGITGTMGHKELLEKFRTIHNILGTIMPPHYTNLRRDLPPRFTENHEQHIKAIRRELTKNIADTQLIIGTSTEECRHIFQKLQSLVSSRRIQPVNLVLATAEGYFKFNPDIPGNPEQIDEKTYIKLAQEKRTIIIATPILGRGVNIPNLTKVIRVDFDPNARSTAQVDGRTGRYGNRGTTIGIYNWRKICETFGLLEADAKTTSTKKRREILDRLRKTAQQEEVRQISLASKRKEISIQYQEYFDTAIRQADSEDVKNQLLLAKHQLIEKLETLCSKIYGIDPENTLNEIAEEIDKRLSEPDLSKELREKALLFKAATDSEDRQHKAFAYMAEQIFAEIAQKHSIARTEPNRTQTQHEATFCSIGRSLQSRFQTDDESLVEEYNSRVQLIYSNETPRALDEEDKNKIANQFANELNYFINLTKKIRSFPPSAIKISDIGELTREYFGPYFTFANHWERQNHGLQTAIDNQLKKIIDTIKTIKTDGEHLMVYHLGKARLAIDEPDLTTAYDIDHLTKNQKTEILNKLKEHLKERGELMEKIENNKPTGDFLTDYYVMLLKKQRGFFHSNSFGPTDSFKQLLEHIRKQRQIGQKQEQAQKATPTLEA